jgi:hypothetical protein
LTVARAEAAIEAAETRWWKPEPPLVEVTACHRLDASTVRCDASELVGWSPTCGDLFVSGEDEAALQGSRIMIYIAAERAR